MISSILEIIKGVWKYRKAVSVGLALAIIFVLYGWNSVLRRDVKSWKLKVDVSQEQSKEAIEGTKRAEAGRKLLASEIDKYMERAKENERKVADAKNRMDEISKEADLRVEDSKKKAAQRIEVLQKKLKGLSQCQQCLVGLDWLNKEVGWEE